MIMIPLCSNRLTYKMLQSVESRWHARLVLLYNNDISNLLLFICSFVSKRKKCLLLFLAAFYVSDAPNTYNGSASDCIANGTRLVKVDSEQKAHDVINFLAGLRDG